MPDIVISGMRGFIGSSLADAFARDGLVVESYDDFRESNSQAATFIHCANIGNDARANARLTAQAVATVGPRVQRVVQFLTFATLHGKGALDATKLNFGKKPLFLETYGLGKLDQEVVMMAARRNFPRLELRLIYMPAVVGGGVWDRNREQAHLHGVRLPVMMHENARANFIDVRDVHGRLAKSGGNGVPGLSRELLNSPESRNLTWEQFFAGSSIGYDDAAKHYVKLALTKAKMLRFRKQHPQLQEADIEWTPDIQPRRLPRANHSFAIPAIPLRFGGEIQHIVRTQPYLGDDNGGRISASVDVGGLTLR